MHDKKELCDSIRSLYPEIGECGIEVNVEFDEGKKVWGVDLKKGVPTTLKTFLEPVGRRSLHGRQTVCESGNSNCPVSGQY